GTVRGAAFHRLSGSFKVNWPMGCARSARTSPHSTEGSPKPMATITHLSETIPQLSIDELLAGFHPSYRFGEVSFNTYRPDPNQPSQTEAVHKLTSFAESVGKSSSGSFFGKLFGKKKESKNGIYLDGGFGVGKTHLL